MLGRDGSDGTDDFDLVAFGVFLFEGTVPGAVGAERDVLGDFGALEVFGERCWGAGRLLLMVWTAGKEKWYRPAAIVRLAT